jgi:hypothetical protein
MKQYHSKYHISLMEIPLTSFKLYQVFLEDDTHISSPPFYTKYVQLPGADYHLPHHFQSNPKFMLFFKDALGAVVGSHIHCAPPALEHSFFRNCKGFISQNCFLHALSYYNLYTPCVAGRDQHLMQEYLMMPNPKTFLSLTEIIILPMLASLHAKDSLLPTGGFSIIFLNGVMQLFGVIQSPLT